MTATSARPVVRPYRWLAQFYDEFYASVRTPIILAREQLLADLLKQCLSGCDLCCGTGDTAMALAQQGLSMYGVDLSPGMCKAARAKAAQSGLPIRILRADMRNFALPKQVDLVTCEFDALNHVDKHSDLRRVLRCVARALRPGGHFFFDVNHWKGFASYWRGTLFTEQPGVACVMRFGNQEKAQRAWADIDWFVREGRQWTRHHERVEEVCWTTEEIHQELHFSGFSAIHEWDSSPFFKNDPLIGPGCRSIYLATKT